MIDARAAIQFYSRHWIEDEADVFPQIEGERRRIEQALKHVTSRLAAEIRKAQAISLD